MPVAPDPWLDGIDLVTCLRVEICNREEPGSAFPSGGGSRWSPTLRSTREATPCKGATLPEALLDDLRDESLREVGIRSAVPSDVPQEPPLSPKFGTRCSTVVAIDDQGRGVIIERRYIPAGDEEGETVLSFSWSG